MRLIEQRQCDHHPKCIIWMRQNETLDFANGAFTRHHYIPAYLSDKDIGHGEGIRVTRTILTLKEVKFAVAVRHPVLVPHGVAVGGKQIQPPNRVIVHFFPRGVQSSSDDFLWIRD